MGDREDTMKERLDEHLRRRGIALSADEFVQVIADALDDLPKPDSRPPALPT